MTSTKIRLTPRVREILSWYEGENLGVLTNLSRLLMSGTLAGSGKMVILPVDQGFEHGPIRTFLPNPEGFDPHYHFELALESGCSAYAAPWAQLQAAYPRFIGEIPLIVKMNSSDLLSTTGAPDQSITCTVPEALRLGAAAVGFTIYPGSSARTDLFEEVREIATEARSYGLPTVVWSYPRGEGLSKDAETAVDTVSYAAHIACQLGAHIVKVKPPSATLATEPNRKAIESARLPVGDLADRIALVVRSCFGGRRIVIFSGGEAKSNDQILSEVAAIHKGGGFGSIMGRNAFQRPRAEAVKLLQQVMQIYKGEKHF
ncbi:MAG: class I fructose-bisphosphate aldolase [Bdellovibrionota bacterium]|nr:MAG: class I fructose-bisphosphate aldolase [Bdellovibrionota bacterium]